MAAWSLTACTAFEQTLLFLDMLCCVHFPSWEFLFCVYWGLTLVWFLPLASDVLSTEVEIWAYTYISTSRHMCHIRFYSCCVLTLLHTTASTLSCAPLPESGRFLHAFFIEYTVLLIAAYPKDLWKRALLASLAHSATITCLLHLSAAM